MFLSDLSIKRPIMMTMFLVVFLLFGGIAYFSMNLDLMPQIDIPYITIQTVYGGAGPTEVESQITKKIEDAVSSVSKIDEMTSYSMENVSFIIIKFEMGKDANIANQEVKDKVDKIVNDLPEDADLPIIERMNLNEEPILDIVLSGDVTITELYEIADLKLKDRFSQIEGVARVNLSGGQQREILVELDNQMVMRNQLSLPQLAQILAAHNLDMPGGNFDKTSQQYTVRLDGEFDSPETIANLKIPTRFGTKKLSHLGNVMDTGEKIVERTSFFNNELKQGNDNIVLLSIVKNTEGNAVNISSEVREKLPEIQAELPAGCRLELVADKSDFIKSSVNDTLSNIIMGIILTALVLLFFLHDLRSTIIVAISMPMSIISSFMLMSYSGFTLNTMTLMGLSTAVGVLVTNSVVVLENIFRHKELGENRINSAARGTSEVVVAVVASAMTNIAVFLPVANMSGMVGQFFTEFALTVTYTTIFSLVISFTLTPMLASLILPESNGKKHKLGDRLEKMFHAWEKGYQNLVRGILSRRRYGLMVIVVSILLFIASLPFAARMGFEFMPMFDEGDIRIEVELPVGYNLRETAKLLQSVEDKIKKYPEVKQILTTIGKISDTNLGANVAVNKIKLVDASEREISTERQVELIIRDLSTIPNAQIRALAISSMSAGDQAPIMFNLMGQDIKKLEALKNEIEPRLKNIPGLLNLNTSSRSGKPEIVLTPDRQKLADAGLTVYDLAMTLRSAVDGIVATKFRESGEEYDVRVKMSEQSINTPEKLGQIRLSNGSQSYTLSQLANIKFESGVSQILHLDKYKMIQFSAASASNVPMGDVMNGITAELEQVKMPAGYKVKWGGMSEIMQETIMDMLFTFILAIILTYMLLGAILESFTQPLLILGTVPLALIGVFVGMFITGKTMNVISMMAIIMLLGIVVNNAILLMDYTNELRRQGMSKLDALVKACPTKLKPILMSTIAIILGMMPMAMGLGDAGREMRQPMGIVAIGGLVVSTLLSLVVIPVLYNLLIKEKTAVITD